MTRILIDADMVLYKASLHAEEVVEWYDGLYTLYADKELAKVHFDNLIQELS